MDPSLSGFELLDALETAIAENHPDTMEGPPAQAEVVHVPTDTQLRQDESRPGALPWLLQCVGPEVGCHC